MVASCKSDYEKKVEYESAARNDLHKMSEDLCVLVKNRIAKQLAHGVKCLRDTIAVFNDVDRYEECLQLIEEINLPKIVTSILKSSSEKYICPRVNDYNEMHGFQSRLPAGRIVHGTETILDNTKDRKNKMKQCRPEEGEDIAQSQNQHATPDEELKISQEEQDAPKNITDQDGKTDSESYEDEEETSEAPPSGICQMRKPRVYVTVPTKVMETGPGLLKLKKGLRIKQKVGFDDEELCFGWYRPRMRAAKVWGFYFKRHVLESNK